MPRFHMTPNRLLSPFVLSAAVCLPVLAQDSLSNPGLPAISAGNQPCRIAWPAKPSTDQVVEIRLLMQVSVDGRVSDSKIVASSGYREFDKAAITSVSRCRFEPASRDGAPAAAWFTFRHAWLPDRKAVLQVSKEGFQIFGQTITSGDELLKALQEHHTEFAEIRIGDSQDDEQLGRAIYAVNRCGVQTKVLTQGDSK